MNRPNANERARVALEAGQAEEAAQIAAEVLEGGNADFEIRLIYAHSCMDLSWPQAALRWLLDFPQVDEEDEIRRLMMLGYLREAMGDPVAAREHCNEVLQLDPSNCSAMALIGTIDLDDGYGGRAQASAAKIATLESIKSSLDNTSALLEIQRTEAENKRLKAEVETIGNCSPVFDCAIRSLQDQLLKMSSEIHSDVVSNYRSIPERISPDSGKQICEIKVSGGVNWDFMISVNTRRSEIDRGDPPYLSISSGEINLEIDPENENGRVVTIVQGGGRDAIHDTGPMNDYHPVIDKAVGYLIAATSEFNEKQTKAPQTH